MTMSLSDTDGFSLADIEELLPVSRETLDRLETLVSELDRWRITHNLIGPDERARLWRRHVLDSLQVWSYREGSTNRWIDLGSGSGFPALVIACATVPEKDTFTLVESNGKKAAYLRAASRKAGLSTRIINDRIENVPRETYEYVTARALASLPRLFEHAIRFCSRETRCIFQKGKGLETEIEEAMEDWAFEYDVRPSLSHPEGRILIVRDLTRRTL